MSSFHSSIWSKLNITEYTVAISRTHFMALSVEMKVSLSRWNGEGERKIKVSKCFSGFFVLTPNMLERMRHIQYQSKVWTRLYFLGVCMCSQTFDCKNFMMFISTCSFYVLQIKNLASWHYTHTHTRPPQAIIAKMSFPAAIFFSLSHSS